MEEGRHDDAEQLFLGILRAELADPVTIAYTVRAVGMLRAGTETSGDAARSIGAGDAGIDSFGLVDNDSEIEPRAVALDRIEARIGPAATAELLREGGRLTLVNAAAFALGSIGAERRARAHRTGR